MTVEDRPVSAPDLLATICLALGLDPRKQNMSSVGRAALKGLKILGVG
ncbi:MAG TPA: hypothetical protein VHX68_14860 [Planctomycetaceae bacterium]|nr:hypothetical protein [Planctomycetaceae bacterium]